MGTDPRVPKVLAFFSTAVRLERQDRRLLALARAPWFNACLAMRLLEALRNQSAKIAADLENSKLFTHMGDRGSFREAIIKDFLRPFLPDCFGLSSGEIFSMNGAQSAQVDIVVYDAAFSTVLFRNGPHQLFPAESVYGSIEVKSNLSLSEMDRACENVASVKKLPRRPADTLDLLPFLRLELGPPLTGGGDFRNPYLGIVFGYSGIEARKIVEDLSHRLQEHPEAKQLLPDFVFVARPGYVITRIAVRDGKDRPLLGGGQDYDKFLWTSTGEDTLPLFYLTLNACLSHLRLRAPDFVHLWTQLFLQLVLKA
jgi:hypothetical protein